MRLCLFAAAFALCASSAAFAQADNQPVADMLACQTVKGSKARLACFEAKLPALREAFPEAVALAAERADAARLSAAEQAKEDFGLSGSAKTEASNEFEKAAFGASDLPTNMRDEDDEEVKSVASVAVEVGKNNAGKIFVILENGQVWRQVSGDRSTPYIPSKSEGLPVIISKGIMGAYFVKVGKAKAAFKAERIK